MSLFPPPPHAHSPSPSPSLFTDDTESSPLLSSSDENVADTERTSPLMASRGLARHLELQPSSQDRILRPTFQLGAFLLSFSFLRLWLILVLLPLYLIIQWLAVLPSVLRSLPALLRPGKWSESVQRADAFRLREHHIAQQQLEESFYFHQWAYFRQLAESDVEVLKVANWAPVVDKFMVCGLRVNVIRMEPVEASGKTIVLLHGNPSWSYMWRNVIPFLTASGHRVLALDWLGFGLSDKPMLPSRITFELHMRSLLSLFEQYELKSAIIAAHDWGGCIALSTIPFLEPDACAGIFCLDTFLPLRPTDAALKNYAFYWIWFLYTGILGGYAPVWSMIRYMSPNLTTQAIRGYEAPFSIVRKALGWREGARALSGVQRFAHITPALPDYVLFGLRNTWIWRLAEGIVGPARFTHINTQARLAQWNVHIRSYWSSPASSIPSSCLPEIDGTSALPPISTDSDGIELEAKKPRRPKVAIVFGMEDSFLKDFKQTLERTIDPALKVPTFNNGWIHGSGHYAVEDAPEEVGLRILQFAERVFDESTKP